MSWIATLEVEGGWLDISEMHEMAHRLALSILKGNPKRPGPRMLAALQSSGMNITLTPDTPARTCPRNSSLLVSVAKNAACFTLFLGKLALVFRNFIEHGRDYPEDHCLTIDSSEYWSMEMKLHSFLDEPFSGSFLEEPFAEPFV